MRLNIGNPAGIWYHIGYGLRNRLSDYSCGIVQQPLARMLRSVLWQDNGAVIVSGLWAHAGRST